MLVGSGSSLNERPAALAAGGEEGWIISDMRNYPVCDAVCLYKFDDSGLQRGRRILNRCHFVNILHRYKLIQKHMFLINIRHMSLIK